MDRPNLASNRQLSLRRVLFLCAAALQFGCGVIFLFDVLNELNNVRSEVVLEAFAVLGLALGATLTLREYRSLLRRNTKVERELGLASGAFQEIVADHFTRWGLTAAERDVALFLIKGLPVAEIASLRQTREGTIKAQSAAIYRKAAVSSRSELLSVMFEELIHGLTPPHAAAQNQSITLPAKHDQT